MKIKPSNIKGSVKVSGSKNASLPIIVGSLLNKNKTVLKNIPNIKDIDELITISTYLGANITKKKSKLVIKPNMINKDILHTSCKSFRASYYLMGLYLALFNHVKIYLPGGCNIGSRPIDYHLAGFEALGAKYKIIDDIIEIALIRPKATTINLPKKSLGATVNLILLASSIKGLTTINNIPSDPELVDFIYFMKASGLDIIYEGNSVYINGGPLINKKHTYKVIPDRIEASTFICLGLITNKLKIKNINIEHLNNIIKPLLKRNANIKIKRNSVVARKSNIEQLEILSGNYPKLSTDIFPLILPVMAYSNYKCKLKETIYESRFEVCNELSKLGVNIETNKNECIIYKTHNSYIDNCTATDLRCAASLLIYAISTNREISINNIEIIHRGYSNLYSKLNRIGLSYTIE